MSNLLNTKCTGTIISKEQCHNIWTLKNPIFMELCPEIQFLNNFGQPHLCSCGTCAWKAAPSRHTRCMSSFVLSWRSCTTTITFSTDSAAALARTGTTSPLDLTAIRSKFSLVLLLVRTGPPWKLARTLTGYNQTLLQEVKGCSTVSLAGSIEKVRMVRDMTAGRKCHVTWHQR